MTTPLLSQRQTITQIINGVVSLSPANKDDPARLALRRKLLLTLHVLFPTQLLPALDLLDRRLLTRITLQNTEADQEDAISPQTYIAKSAVVKQRYSKSTNTQPQTTYLVQVQAWNCSCASFAYESYGMDTETTSTTGQVAATDIEAAFGGTSVVCIAAQGETLPCCKHLLACLLTEKWPQVFTDNVEERLCTRDEYATFVGYT